MPPLPPRKTVLFPALLLSVALPVSAASASEGGALCALAAKDPVAFVSHPEFNERLLEMSGTCDDLVFALTSVTGSIPAAEGRSGEGPARSQVVAPDYSDLVVRLEQATAKLEGATEEVERRQAALDRTIRRAKRIGLKDEDFMLVAVLATGDDDLKIERLASVLPDYTEAKREALERVLNAKEALDKANDRLAKATDAARDLVDTAAKLSGLADKAQGELSDVLGGMSSEELAAEIRATLEKAEKEADALGDKADDVEKKLNSVQKALNDALNSQRYTKAVKDLEKEENRYNLTKEEVAKAQDAFDKAFAKLTSKEKQDLLRDLQDDEKDDDDKKERCKSKACEAAKKAADKLDDAKDELKYQARDVEEAKADLEKVAKSLKIADLSASIVTLTGDLDAVTKAEKKAAEEAEAAKAKAKELADLMEKATKALEDAKAASQAAKEATAKEEQDVIAAQAGLKAAMAYAADLLEGSEEEAAARQAVLDAQDELTRALAALGAAQDTAAALAEEIANVADAPAEVTEAGAELAEASKDGEEAASEARETMEAADEALEAHDEATEDLKAAVEETSEAPAAPESSAGAES